MASRLREAIQAPLASVVAIALVSGLSWIVVTPAFQGPDELGHFGYAQYLAENSELPGKSGVGEFSNEEGYALEAVNYHRTQLDLTQHPFWSKQRERDWKERSAKLRESDRKNGGGETFATPNPPLYYAYVAIPYRLAEGDLFNRLQAMRLGSLILFVGTVVFTWLLAGELFGRNRAAQTVAALFVALQPMVTFVLTSIHPDTMLTFLYSGTIYSGVRLLKRGASPIGVLALAVFIGAALFTKLIAPALVPAAVFAVVLALVRSQWSKRKMALVGGTATVLAAAPIVFWSLLYPLLGRKTVSSTLVETAAGNGETSIPGFISYLLQWYIPKLPLLEPIPYTKGWPLYDTAIKGFWGQFGANPILGYPGWLIALLAAVTFALLGLALRALYARRKQIVERSNWPIATFIAAIVAAHFLLVHYVSYKNAVVDQAFFQSRYLLPLISVFAVLVALAVTSLPKRSRRPAATVIVSGLFALDLYALCLNTKRFYFADGTFPNFAVIFDRMTQYGANWEDPALIWALLAAIALIPFLCVRLLRDA